MVSAIAAALLLVPAAPANATQPGVRLDQQSQENLVAVPGLARGKAVRVDWGDGTSWEKLEGRCAPARLKSAPQECIVGLGHIYSQPGTYAITVRKGKSVLTQQEHVVTPAPVRGVDDQPHVSNWSSLQADRRATFYPCENVSWYLDPAGQSEGREGMAADIAAGLEQIAIHTGLTFTQVGEPAQASLKYSWGSLDGAAGQGGGRMGSATVVFDNAVRWTEDNYAGLDFVTREWEEGGKRWRLATPGRAWLVIHETLHALGMGHVDDAAEVMNGSGVQVAGFGPGDIEGMAALYKNNQCVPL